ncbi:MAG: hypothetical protein KF865_09115 [Bdellovibrionaceae bacterium]|nr:hypothetical protein [Pseudobdellovibrionaceae bacterium]
MSFYCRIIQSTDLDEIIDYENRKLAESVADENERTLQSWHARWRKEALEHYLGLGWSFLVRDRDVQSPFSPEGQLIGYFIAQPLLFFDGQTQSLWLEHLSYSSLQARDELSTLAYRLSREKHFQRVFFPNQSGVANSVATFKPEAWNSQVLCVKTSKA